MSKVRRVLIITIIVLILALLSAGLYFLLDYFGITNVKTLRDFVSKFGAWSWLVFILLQCLISTPIFVMPLEDELWVTLSILLFGVKVGCVISIISMIATSSLLYLIGKVFGFKLAKKLVGEKTLNDVQQKFSVKSKLSLPFLYLIPFFPHDALCILSGIGKMRFIYFAIITLFMRSIEIVSICFLGGGFIDWAELTKFEWLVFVNLLIIDIYLLLKLQKIMEKKITHKKDNHLDIK